MYPLLSKFARRVLSVPATSTPSQSVFSKGRLLLSHTRGSLPAEKFRASICLGKWQKKMGVGTFVFLFPHLVRTRVWGQLRLLHWLAKSHGT